MNLPNWISFMKNVLSFLYSRIDMWILRSVYQKSKDFKRIEFIDEFKEDS